MDAVTALNAVLTVLDTIAKVEPIAMAGIQDVQVFSSALYTQWTGEKLTDAQIDTIEAKNDELAAQIQKPLSPAQPGDPDFKG